MSGLSISTVCFISTVTFHDGITQKVIKIIQFCKKSLKDSDLAFCNKQFQGLFEKNISLQTHYELENILSKKGLFYYVVSQTAFLIISLILKRFELLMPDWSQMRDIFM